MNLDIDLEFTVDVKPNVMILKFKLGFGIYILKCPLSSNCISATCSDILSDYILIGNQKFQDSIKGAD